MPGTIYVFRIQSWTRQRRYQPRRIYIYEDKNGHINEQDVRVYVEYWVGQGIEWGECGYFRWSDQKELYEEMKFDLRSKG